MTVTIKLPFFVIVLQTQTKNRSKHYVYVDDDLNVATETLDLQSNEINVDISELDFTVLNGIKTIDLSYNGDIYGTVYLQNLPSSLDTLYLHYDSIISMDDCFNASISCEMDNVYNLQVLNLAYNQMSGTINWQMFQNTNNLLYLNFGYDPIACAFIGCNDYSSSYIPGVSRVVFGCPFTETTNLKEQLILVCCRAL